MANLTIAAFENTQPPRDKPRYKLESMTDYAARLTFPQKVFKTTAVMIGASGTRGLVHVTYGCQSLWIAPDSANLIASHLKNAAVEAASDAPVPPVPEILLPGDKPVPRRLTIDGKEYDLVPVK